MDSAKDAATDTEGTIPAHSRYVIVGAGIHGLSTGWHLARELGRRGLGGAKIAYKAIPFPYLGESYRGKDWPASDPAGRLGSARDRDPG